MLEAGLPTSLYSRACALNMGVNILAYSRVSTRSIADPCHICCYIYTYICGFFFYAVPISTDPTL